MATTPWTGTPPRGRQVVVNLEAGVKSVGDGERRVIQAGEVILAGDFDSGGYLSRSITTQLRHSLLRSAATEVPDPATDDSARPATSKFVHA
jgi:hypothetical protein